MYFLYRSSDCEMIANYRVQAELSSIDSTYDGKSIVLGTVDGCLSVLAIADPKKPEMKEYLANVPSRDEEVRYLHNRTELQVTLLAQLFFFDLITVTDRVAHLSFSVINSVTSLISTLYL